MKIMTRITMVIGVVGMVLMSSGCIVAPAPDRREVRDERWCYNHPRECDHERWCAEHPRECGH